MNRIRAISIGAGVTGAAAACAFAIAGVMAHAPAPPSAAATAPAGRAIYEAHCAECHGSTGQGDGPAAAFLTPRPLDFTSGKYKIRTTETGSIPTDADLMRSVVDGLPGSAMPGWRGVISEADMLAVIAYIKSLTPRFTTEQPKPVIAIAAVPADANSTSRGQRAYERLRCAACHGTDGRGAGAIATEFWDDWKQPLRATDLTAPWTFHGGAAARDVYMRFRTGLSGTPMPSFVDAASDPEMWDLANYVVSLARTPVWSMIGPDAAAEVARIDADGKVHPVKRGQYLVETIGCPICHSPYDAQKRILPGMRLAGGQLVRVVPFGDFPTGNLTSDKETGLGGWTDEEIKRTVTKGILKDGTRLLPYPMDWASYSNLTPDDLNALVAYLRTVPPVRNRVPKPKWTSFPVYMWGKFKMLVLGDDPPMLFYPGNYATNGEQR
jgi:mono/diheme cytochrome c family protein